ESRKGAPSAKRCSVEIGPLFENRRGRCRFRARCRSLRAVHGHAPRQPLSDHQSFAQLATYGLELICGTPTLVVVFVFTHIFAISARGRRAGLRLVADADARICQAAFVPDVSVFVSQSM